MLENCMQLIKWFGICMGSISLIGLGLAGSINFDDLAQIPCRGDYCPETCINAQYSNQGITFLNCPTLLTSLAAHSGNNLIAGPWGYSEPGEEFIILFDPPISSIKFWAGLSVNQPDERRTLHASAFDKNDHYVSLSRNEVTLTRDKGANVEFIANSDSSIISKIKLEIDRGYSGYYYTAVNNENILIDDIEFGGYNIYKVYVPKEKPNIDYGALVDEAKKPPKLGVRDPQNPRIWTTGDVLHDISAASNATAAEA